MNSAAAVRQARFAGLFYVVTTITAVFAEVIVRGRLVVRSDAAATAHNILTNESLYRWGFVADLINFGAYIAVTLLLYSLLRRVNPNLAAMALLFSIVAQTIGALVALGHLAPLIILSGSHYLSVFSTGQLQAMALLALRLHAQGYFIALVFFGVYNLLLGHLIFASRFFPRWLGVLVAVSGAALLINSFAFFLFPANAGALAPIMDILDGLGEIALILWLLIAGVNSKIWEQMAV